MDIERMRSMLLSEIESEKEKQKRAGIKMQLLNVYNDEPIEEPIDEPINELIEETDEEPIDEQIDEPIEETDEEPIEETDEEETDDKEPSELADMCFKLDEIKMLTEIGLPIPSQITESEKSNLFDKARKLMEKLGGKKGLQIKKGNTEAVNLLDEILNLLRVYMGLLKPSKDQTGGRYRRNAYKIGSGGEYGTLVIHLPGLFKNHVLEAFKNGVKVMKQPIDDDTIDLLTKRFNGNKNYSELSKDVFNKLNQLSQIPDHRRSKKMLFAPTKEFQFEEPQDEFQFEEPKDEFQYDEPQDEIHELLARLEDLIADFKEGFDFAYKQDEFIDIINDLYNRGTIDDSQRRQFFRNYL